VGGGRRRRRGVWVLRRGGRIARMLDRLEFKPHLGGHGDKAQYSRGVLHGARALTSIGMLPHCGVGELSTQALRQ